MGILIAPTSLRMAALLRHAGGLDVLVRLHLRWRRFFPVEVCVGARPVGNYIVQEYLRMELAGAELPPVIGFAAEVHHGIAGPEFETDGLAFRCFYKNWPSRVLREIQCNADLAGIPVAVTQQLFAVLIDPSIGVGRQHRFVTQLGNHSGFFDQQPDEKQEVVSGW